MATTNEFDFNLTETADDPDRAFVRRQLQVFNRAMLPDVFREDAQIPHLNVFARNPAGVIVGGVVADIHWTSLQIEYLWVAESQRGMGLGRALVQRVEAAARKRGCTWAALTTFDFQARGFYEKLGYRIVGVQEDYPPGHRYYWLRHDFEA